jgi:predicted transcriptional regulator
MPRLSIELTAEQHKRLKAIAALRGQSIKDYVFQQSLGDLPTTEQAALQQLEALLRPRVAEAERGEVVTTSATEIFEPNSGSWWRMTG